MDCSKNGDKAMNTNYYHHRNVHFIAELKSCSVVHSN